MKNILHISDLHLSVDKKKGLHIDNCKSLIENLLSDINNNSFEIDTVFITGDISFSGQSVEFEKIYDEFIEPLLSRLSVGFNDLYIVPGNHDMDRTKVSKPEILSRKHGDEQDLNEVFNLINNKSESWNRIDNYSEFKSKIHDQQNNIIFDSPIVTVRECKKNLLIHCVNSAWLACDDEDCGLLRILSCLNESVGRFGKNKKNVVLMHHPLNWISKDEYNAVSRIIEKRVDAVFYGHMHEFEQSVTINFNNDITLKLQAGTIDTRSNNSGYSFISLDSNDSFEYGKIYYRKFDKEDGCYKPWEERIENGFSNFSIDKRSIFDSTKFCDKSTSLMDEVELSHLVNTGRDLDKKRKLSDIFIEPKISCEHTIEVPDVTIIKKFCDIEKSDGCILISATEQQGRTTVLKKIQIDYLSKQSNFDLKNIVFYIDLNFNYNTKHKILNYFISNYEDDDLKTSFSTKLKSCISDGNAIFLMDNFDKCDDDSQKAVLEFINQHSENKFIISGEIDNCTKNLTKLVTSYTRDVFSATISNIGRCDIRQIISLRPINSPLHSEDELFQNLVKLVDK